MFIRLFLFFALAVLSVPGNALQITYPTPPVDPKDMKECTALAEAWSRLNQQLLHELSKEIDYKKQKPIVAQMDALEARRDADLGSCRAKVTRYQEAAEAQRTEQNAAAKKMEEEANRREHDAALKKQDDTDSRLERGRQEREAAERQSKSEAHARIDQEQFRSELSASDRNAYQQAEKRRAENRRQEMIGREAADFERWKQRRENSARRTGSLPDVPDDSKDLHQYEGKLQLWDRAGLAVNVIESASALLSEDQHNRVEGAQSLAELLLLPYPVADMAWSEGKKRLDSIVDDTYAKLMHAKKDIEDVGKENVDSRSNSGISYPMPRQPMEKMDYGETPAQQEADAKSSGPEPEIDLGSTENVWENQHHCYTAQRACEARCANDKQCIARCLDEGSSCLKRLNPSGRSESTPAYGGISPDLEMPHSQQ
jgi:hypothetical protein